LNEEESKYFEQLIKPKTTKIGTDAIAFISNKNNNDTLVGVERCHLVHENRKPL
jgi:phosphate transport system substrate-binding protein